MVTIIIVLILKVSLIHVKSSQVPTHLSPPIGKHQGGPHQRVCRFKLVDCSILISYICVCVHQFLGKVHASWGVPLLCVVTYVQHPKHLTCLTRPNLTLIHIVSTVGLKKENTQKVTFNGAFRIRSQPLREGCT